LSRLKGLRRHSRVAEPRNLRRASPEAAVDFAVLAFRASPSGKTRENERILSPSETSGFATLAASP
jgi:hypothetical protein